MTVWIGADWDSEKCVVFVQDGDEQSSFKVIRHPEAVEGFMARWSQHDVFVGIEIGDAIWPRLWEQAGAHVFVFDAKQAKRFQETLGSSGASDDLRAAEALCAMVQSHPHRHNAQHRPSETQRTLDNLVRRHEMLSRDNQARGTQLRSLLKQFHPALADKVGSVRTKAILKLLEVAATPLEWNALEAERQSELLRQLGNERREAVEPVLGECWVAMGDLESQAAGDRIRSVARFLHLGLDEENAARRALDDMTEHSEPMQAAVSVVGIGPKLGAGIALAYEVAGADDRDALNRRMSTAPITKRSGARGDASPHVMRRFAVIALLKNIGYLVGVQAVQRMGWAKAKFQHHRSKGINAAGAYRRVSRSLMRVIHALIRDNAKFDEARYVAGLKAKGVEWAMAL